MKANTLQMVSLALTGDDTITDGERKAIITFCRNPVPMEPRGAPAANSADRWLSPKEAAEIMSVSLRTVQRMVRMGVLPSRKVLSCRRIPMSALAALPERPGEESVNRPSRESTDPGCFVADERTAAV